MKKYILQIIVILFLLSPHSTLAAQVGLSLEPSLVRAQIKPGKSITKIFNIENTSDSDKNLVARIVPFSKSDNIGNPLIDLKSTPPWLNYFGLSNSNIKLNEPFPIKGKGKEQLVLSMAIPENAKIEDIYLTLLVSTYDNSISADKKGTQISASIGSNLLISITSELDPTTILKVEKIIPSSGSFIKLGRKYFADNLTPMTFVSSVVNEGPFITETKGTFKVSKKSEVLQIQGLLPQYVINKTSRVLIDSDNNPFIFKPNLTTFGNHTISISIKSQNTNTSNSIEIIFVPFKAILAILSTIIILKIIFTVTTKKVS